MKEDAFRRPARARSDETRPPRPQGRETEAVNSDPVAEDIDLAQRLYAEWQAGKAKSRIERETWNDGHSHGRHFDRVISRMLGLPTVKGSKLSDRVGDLEGQVRSLGQVPVGALEKSWERQLIHARQSCLSALRVWNDPTASFRAEAFSLLLVTAWNALCIAILQKRDQEWRSTDDSGAPIQTDGTDRALDTRELVARAFPEEKHLGLRQNLRTWIDLRNSVAHRHLPALDHLVIPHAQAALMNFENAIVGEFGPSFAIAERLSVPLQLSGFRDPGVLASRKKLQASLPLDVQLLLAQPELDHPALGSDDTFLLRVAFIPVVPSSTSSPDAIAYFVKPGEVPDAISESIEQYLVLPKGYTTRPSILPTEVVKAVQERTGYRFNTNLHAEAARRLGARPPRDEPDATVDIRLAEWISAHKRHLYTRAWIDLLSDKLSTPEGFLEATGRNPVPVEPRCES